MSYGRKFYKIVGGVVLMPWTMLNSPAYRELKPSSAKALPFFLGKVKFGRKSGIAYADPQYYEAEFRYPVHEAKVQGFAPGTFAGIIWDLVDKGFIDPVRRGGMKSDGLGFSRFRLSQRWERYGKADFQRVDWDNFKIRKPRVRSREEANAFLHPEDLKHFAVPKAEITQCQKSKKKRGKRVAVSKIGTVGVQKC